MKSAILFCLLTTLLTISHWGFADQSTIPLTDWMAQTNDSLPLSAITIPGSHDSGAMYEPIAGTAKTQNLTIREQLLIGVRYLDIRLRHYEDALVVHHGAVYQHLNFDDVLVSVTDFLAAHPTETILMEVSQEYEAYNNTRSFEQTFVSYENNDLYRDFWWTHSYIPQLGEVRGKIVLLRRFAGSFWTSGGIDITSWADNAESDIYDTRNRPIHIQDYYVVKVTSNDNKWRAIKQNLNAAKNDTQETLYINFSSGYRPVLGIPNYPSVANDINARLINYFGALSGQKQHHGIIVSDFISEQLTRSELASYL
ncbi:phosphatidylinositol-specific phospholipase C [Gynuella sp.]|uniref:phosphatidylinositol-specific phospholipase C n=1 Tax=Gynuella sp. TaxID=2969146 RepID=UPI003D0E7CBB